MVLLDRWQPPKRVQMAYLSRDVTLLGGLAEVERLLRTAEARRNWSVVARNTYHVFRCIRLAAYSKGQHQVFNVKSCDLAAGYLQFTRDHGAQHVSV